MSTTNEDYRGDSNRYVFKSRLHEFAQKVGLPTPVYESINEGTPHEPSFRSTVVVNGVRHDSLVGFSNHKAAEQSAAEVALKAYGVSNWYVFKCRLQDYAHKAGLPNPVYETINEGPPHEPSFRSTVVVNGVQYDSFGSFFNRKDADGSAAEVALVELGISGAVKRPFTRPHDETGLCKNLLRRYAQKMNYAMPTYQCKMDDRPGRPSFSCTVDIGGILYTGRSSKTKKEAEIEAAKTALLNTNTNVFQSSQDQFGPLTVIPSRKRAADSVADEASKAPKPKKSRFKMKCSKRKLSIDNNAGDGANINPEVESINGESGLQKSEAALPSEALKNYENGVSTNHHEKVTSAGEGSFALNNQKVFENVKSAELQSKEDNLGNAVENVKSA
ncbi:hypothetical protein TSUD_139730 [Trifolium subterraneum]|uniref:DRBM domain-containing protein n=1 Tax=Trifolium subterraneum TaxID=3900 RepID=A0A2Z6N8L7_TRISU|nr:hypothetical protein TSUD_139730 [Trifolium subterraneum]